MKKKIFISYRHSQIEFARELETSLTGKGFQVFRDESDIQTFESISDTIQKQLANAHAMLVILSEDYHRSRYCQWELIAAFISAQQAGQPNQRIFIVNPTADANLLQTFPQELQDAKFAVDVTQTVNQLKQQLVNIEQTFSQLGSLTLAPNYGRSLTGSPRFVGREMMMWKIHSALQGSTKPMVTGHVGPDIAQLSGMGGTGKTLLAEEYALRFSAAYPGGIFWLDAYGSFNPDNPDIEVFKVNCIEQLRKIADSLRLTPSADSSLESLQAMIRQFINRQNMACLWVVDDIPWGLGDYLNDVKNWFSPHPQLSSTLLTTRSNEYNSIGIELPLDVLDYQEAELLLENNQVNLTGQGKEAKILIEKLGRHALATDIAGAAIHKLDLTIGDYLNDLDSSVERMTGQLLDIPREIVATLPSGCEKSIVTSLFRSIGKLSEASLDFLRLAANLAPAAINQEFIHKVFKNADLQEEKISDHATQLSLLGCEQLNLARNNRGKWSVHALVSATIQYLGEDTGTRGKQLRLSAIQLLTENIRYDKDDKSTQALALDVEHARFLTQKISDESELALLNKLGDFDVFRGYPQLAVMDWVKIREITENLLGIDHPDTLTSMNNLAMALKTMGDNTGARELQEHVLERRKAIQGTDHPDTLTSMNNLASTLLAMGDNSDAGELQQHVLERRKAILGNDHPDTLGSMNNLALTLNAMGYNEDAGELQQYVLERRKSILGADHPDTLTSMNNLALTLNAMGYNEDAGELQEHVLERRKALLGADHPDTLTSMNNLALTLKAMRDNAGARKLQHHVLERSKAILGIDHPDTLKSMDNMALTLNAMNDNTGARELQEHALEQSKTILGADHPDTLTSMNNLALTLNAMGYNEDAGELQQYVLERRKAILGIDHPDTLTSMNNLALTLRDMRDISGARVLQQQVLKRRTEILGAEHPTTTLSAWNLFNTLYLMGDRTGFQSVFDNYLVWLLQEGLELHSTDHRQIRDKLKRI